MKEKNKRRGRGAKKKKLSAGRLALLIIALMAIFSFLCIFAYDYFTYLHDLKQVKVYDMRLKVGNYVGFNLDSDVLNFGTIIPTGASTRTINLSTEKPVRVEILLRGKLAEWVNISHNNFILDGQEEIAFNVYVPADAAYGNYTGKAYILFKEP